MKEADFLRYVTDVAKRFGWSVYHVPAPMRHTAKGFVGAKEAAGLCDLMMLHDDPPRLVLAEVKGTGGKLSDEQREFLQSARRVAIRSADRFDEQDQSPQWPATLGVYVWEPGQEAIVEQILRSRVLS